MENIQLRSLGEHLGTYLISAGRGWWIVVAALFGFWDQVVRLLPGSGTLQEAPSWLTQGAMVAALLIGPFLGFRKLLGRVEGSETEANLWKARYQRSFQEFRLETFYGENSGRLQKETLLRLERAVNALLKELRRGDFTRADRLPPLLRTYLPVLRKFFPRGSAAYDQRYMDALEATELYNDRIGGDVGELKLPPREDPPNSAGST